MDRCSDAKLGPRVALLSSVSCTEQEAFLVLFEGRSMFNVPLVGAVSLRWRNWTSGGLRHLQRKKTLAGRWCTL